MSTTTAIEERARQACTAAVLDVLETMFFELPVDCPEVGPLPDEGLLDTSEVSFDGSANGCLRLAAPPELTVPLAEAFLALDEQVTPEESVGLVLGELANMICGNALGRFEPDGIFRLSSPIGKRGQAAQDVDQPNTDWIRFPLENGSLFVGLKVE